jgi:hypothetical protein
MADESNIININGEEYNCLEDFDDKQRYIVDQCRDLQTKRQKAQFEVDQLTGALDFFTKALIESVSDASKEETAVAAIN